MAAFTTIIVGDKHTSNRARAYRIQALGQKISATKLYQSVVVATRNSSDGAASFRCYQAIHANSLLTIRSERDCSRINASRYTGSIEPLDLIQCIMRR